MTCGWHSLNSIFCVTLIDHKVGLPVWRIHLKNHSFISTKHSHYPLCKTARHLITSTKCHKWRTWNPLLHTIRGRLHFQLNSGRPKVLQHHCCVENKNCIFKNVFVLSSFFRLRQHKVFGRTQLIIN